MENNTSPSDIRGHRTLATVVFTDCVGFSARMSEAEDHTLDLIRRDLRLMKRVCEQFEGRVLKNTGDGVLMHFISAVKAVECAIEIQRTLTETAATLPATDTLQHRIGIHLADMFITETDVMGNGVNIAARLQSVADPGGICISQTVYDVIKSGLNLQTRYMGPQELKNIREVVPAYKILLHPEAESLDPMGDVVQQLEQHKSRVRIKKLLIYACNHTWESDPEKLDATSLRELLQAVMQLNPTPEQLDRFLDTAVRSLSKPTEYALIANLVMAAAQPLYPRHLKQPAAAIADSEERTQAIAPQAPVLREHDAIARSLEQAANAARIKKLLFYVCRNRWENNPPQLDSVRLVDLVAELHELAPTLTDLQQRMSQFVQTLSKRAEYTQVANTILTALQLLYPGSDAPVAIAEPLPLVVIPAAPPATSESVAPQYGEVIQALEQAPEIVRIKKLLLYLSRRQWESDPAKLSNLDTSRLVQDLHRLTPTIGQLEASLNAVVKTLNKPAEYGAIAQTILHSMGRLYPEYSAQGVPLPIAVPERSTAALTEPPATAEPKEIQSPFNLFDARLGIMKYANPLLAKIVIFSALHSDFNFSSQDWLSLRMYELDGLLRQLLDQCKSYTDLEALLYGAARRLSDPDANVEIANVIIKCLRPFYLYGGSVSTLAPPMEPTQIDLTFEETRLELDAADEDDRTCELMPATEDQPLTPAAEVSEPQHRGDRPPPPPPPPPTNRPSNLGEVKHARD